MSGWRSWRLFPRFRASKRAKWRDLILVRIFVVFFEIFQRFLSKCGYAIRNVWIHEMNFRLEFFFVRIVKILGVWGWFSAFSHLIWILGNILEIKKGLKCRPFAWFLYRCWVIYSVFGLFSPFLPQVSSTLFRCGFGTATGFPFKRWYFWHVFGNPRYLRRCGKI